eukprot:m.328224 g.328224  ORF g.328224 m.328224 type:complete len:53 (-) comp16565_c0_seq116:4275-4433(-)
MQQAYIKGDPVDREIPHKVVTKMVETVEVCQVANKNTMNIQHRSSSTGFREN